MTEQESPIDWAVALDVREALLLKRERATKNTLDELKELRETLTHWIEQLEEI